MKSEPKKSEGDKKIHLGQDLYAEHLIKAQGLLSQHKKAERYITVQETEIEWSNLIFLPFHPVFELFVLGSVFIKAILGPIQAVYPVVYCGDTMDHNPFLIFIKYCYWYYCDSIYGIDTFLHIVHRQVTDKAMRREYASKSALLLSCDLLSLVPFFRLIESNPCPPARLWPNILAFNEFIVIYRATQYFSLVTTHAYRSVLIGYTIVLFTYVNCIACFWLLLSEEGFCAHCREPENYYDWRAFILHQLNETSENHATYVYGADFIFAFIINAGHNGTKPSAVLEFVTVCLLLVAGYALANIIVLPKVFAESMLRLRTICIQYPFVRKVMNETKRRNPSDNSDQQIENYYKLIWRRRNGIITTPKFFLDLPRYLSIDIKQDLLWPLFYHSPTLRITSYPFRRWLIQTISLTYKLPGEKFYSEQHSNSSLFYIKSGIIQLISADDGTTPILSVTGGTILGDINFIVPHIKRKVLVRCVTYCEIYCVQRKYIIQALHKYPQDREQIMAAVNNRMQHAKTLFFNKKYIRGLDRNEDEGLAWIKKRWWELFNMIQTWTKLSGKSKENLSGRIPHEDSLYHCSKYLSQLALCSRTHLQTKSLFANLEFPWILNPTSSFGWAWHQIVTIHLLAVLLVYPPNLIKIDVPLWFVFFAHFTEVLYAIDIGVSLLTAVKKQEIFSITFSSVMFERFKSFTFLMDLLSTIWFEDLARLVGMPQFYWTLQFMRLIKIYKLFYGDYLKWDIRKDPWVDVCRKICLIQITCVILLSHVVYELEWYVPVMSTTYFFGDFMCRKGNLTNCDPVDPVAGVTIQWAFEMLFAEFRPDSLFDVYVALVVSYISYIVYTYCKGRFVAYLYLKYRDIIRYQNLVSDLKVFYTSYRIHTDLLKRLDRYFICHWKYYNGTDVLYPNTLRDQPVDVYWKSQGQVAERIINASGPFKHANPGLIRELACAGKFSILPKNTNIYVFGNKCKNVTWIAQGYVKSEYYNEEGEMLNKYYGPNAMLSISSILIGKVCLRSYITDTDCEILTIPESVFFDIYKKYRVENSYLDTCVKEYMHLYDEMFQKYILKHRDYRQKLRNRIYSTRMSMISTSKVIADVHETRSKLLEGHFWGDPESSFMQSWMVFRVIMVCINIVSASLLGGVGVVDRWKLIIVSGFCNCVSYMDILFKLCLSYYNHKGILVSNNKKCLINYFTKGFLLDLIGVIPVWQVLMGLMSESFSENTAFLLNTLSKFAHMYILFAYFDYISDIPTVNSTFIMIIKWQIVNILIVFGSSHYLMVKCVNYTFDNRWNLINITLGEQCWMPEFLNLPHVLNEGHLRLIFAQSLNLAESAMLRMNFGRFNIDRRDYGIGFLLFLLGIMFWFITLYTLTLLVLNSRGQNTFQHSVNQLETFLKSERVQKDLIEKVVTNFRYCWIRTKGISAQDIRNERIDDVFRQDLNYYLFKQTFSIMDSLLDGGEAMLKQFASVTQVYHFLPEHDICRENNILTAVGIVHRGKVNVFKDEKKVSILTKGDIFGQLLGSKLRPIRIHAVAEDHVDILFIDFPIFHSAISEKVKKNIYRDPHARIDYMATKKIFVENPYDTVKYLLRGTKMIMLPRAKHPTEATEGSWYVRWLYLSWFIGPFLSASSVMMFSILPSDSKLWPRLYGIVHFADALHLLHFVLEFYTVELVVEKNKCVNRRLGLSKFKDWRLYLDVSTLVVPYISFIISDWRFQAIRLLRLRYFIDFEIHFCRRFKTRLTPVVLKTGFILLMLHFFTCGWIYIACRDDKFPIHTVNMRHMNRTIDFSQWAHPDDRRGGCARTTSDIPDDHGRMTPAFIVPTYWPHDYVVAITYILLIYTHTSIDIVIAVSLKQVYYKLFVTFVMYLLDMWIMAVAVNTVYTKYRELYKYDYGVLQMTTYLSDRGLYKTILDNVLMYTNQLWKKQKGEWLPDLAYLAPPCLRQDMFDTLYMHHLDSTFNFRQTPHFFKRQVVTRLKRIIIFPGKCIVRQGDVFNTTYFIHEGEVEKWYYDASGESKLLSVLFTNSYFGTISGLFVEADFKFSYITRTVVDLVYLDLDAWSDLLEAYPDIKTCLFASTQAFKDDLERKYYYKK